MREPSSATAQHARASAISSSFDTTGADSHAHANADSYADSLDWANRKGQSGRHSCSAERKSSVYRSGLCKLVWAGISKTQWSQWAAV